MFTESIYACLSGHVYANHQFSGVAWENKWNKEQKKQNPLTFMLPRNHQWNPVSLSGASKPSQDHLVPYNRCNHSSPCGARGKSWGHLGQHGTRESLALYNTPKVIKMWTITSDHETLGKSVVVWIHFWTYAFSWCLVANLDAQHNMEVARLKKWDLYCTPQWSALQSPLWWCSHLHQPHRTRSQWWQISCHDLGMLIHDSAALSCRNPENQ